MMVPSYLRTVVPLIAGWLITVLSGLGVKADSAAVTSAVTVAVAALYYGALRLVESAAEHLGAGWLKKAAGWLLGWAQSPEYAGVKSAQRNGS